MAGSLNHIITKNGKFTMDYIENLGDAHEALDECFQIICRLTGGKPRKICKELGFSKPAKRMRRPAVGVTHEQ